MVLLYRPLKHTDSSHGLHGMRGSQTIIIGPRRTRRSCTGVRVGGLWHGGGQGLLGVPDLAAGVSACVGPENCGVDRRSWRSTVTSCNMEWIPCSAWPVPQSKRDVITFDRVCMNSSSLTKTIETLYLEPYMQEFIAIILVAVWQPVFFSINKRI